MATIKYPNTMVTIDDQQGRFVEDKDIKVNLRYSNSEGGFLVATPVTEKRDTSPNIAIFSSDKLAFKLKVHKDGRIGPSGKISQKTVKEIGADAMREEFKKAAEVILHHFGVGGV